MQPRRIPRNTLVAGLAPVLIGLVYLAEVWGYSWGSLRRIGPGAFPVALSILLILFGLAILVFERGGPPGAAEPLPVRGLLVIPAAILAFALLIERAGLGPAVFASVVISSLADRDMRVPVSVAYGLFLAVLSVVIFDYGLRLQVEGIAW